MSFNRLGDESLLSAILVISLIGIFDSLLILRSLRHLRQSLHDGQMSFSHGSQLRPKASEDRGLSIVNFLFIVGVWSGFEGVGVSLVIGELLLLI